MRRWLQAFEVQAAEMSDRRSHRRGCLARMIRGGDHTILTYRHRECVISHRLPLREIIADKR